MVRAYEQGPCMLDDPVSSGLTVTTTHHQGLIIVAGPRWFRSAYVANAVVVSNVVEHAADASRTSRTWPPGRAGWRR